MYVAVPKFVGEKKVVKGAETEKVVVNRQFMMDLARRIYDPETRKFLRLCNGSLQNGPDPKDSWRTMHCGLGELYYAMTGREPEQDGVDETGVIDKAVELSTLSETADKVRSRTKKAVKSLDLPEAAKTQLLENIDNLDDDDLSNEASFREALDEIPGVNDDGCEEGSCSYDDYRSRSARVAKHLRSAAKLLPE